MHPNARIAASDRNSAVNSSMHQATRAAVRILLANPETSAVCVEYASTSTRSKTHGNVLAMSEATCATS